MSIPSVAGSGFRKSSFSGGSGDCVEVGSEDESVIVRDSKLHNGEMLPFSSTVWREFVQTVRRSANV
jgi:hypothetical protein